MGAPMAGVSGAALAFETTKAGGLGFIAAGHLNSIDSFKELEKQIQKYRELAASASASPEDDNGEGKTKHYPLAIGFIGHSTFSDELGWNLMENILEDYEPDVVQFFAPAIAYPPPSIKERIQSSNIVKLCQSYGCMVVAQVGSVHDGIEALDAGVDCLVAQGSEAGGHGIRRDGGNGTLNITAHLVKLAKERKRRIPVLAAGGIVDGKGLVSALALGADGVVLGTRLWASIEAQGPQSYKDALVATKSCDDVVRTQVFDTIWNSYRSTKWPSPFDSSGVLRNEMTEQWDVLIPELRKELESASPSRNVAKALQEAEEGQQVRTACVYSGQGVGEIDSIDHAYDIVKRIEHEATETLTLLQGMCSP
jgi:nitronate monooxygenase